MSNNYKDYLPYKVYEPRNLGNTSMYAYLGKSITEDISKILPKTVKEKEQLSENCNTIMLFGSICGGKNVRLDPATNQDPYTYIDQKWFDLRPFRYYLSWQKKVRGPLPGEKYYKYIENVEGIVDETLPESNILSKRDTYVNNADPIFYIKRVISDGSIIVNANNATFWWGEDGEAHGEASNASPDDEILLEAHEHEVTSSGAGEVSTILSTDYQSDTGSKIYYLRDLEAGPNIALYSREGWVTESHGFVAEDLSDFIDDGFIKVAYYLNNPRIECCDFCSAWGNGEIDSGGGVIFDDTCNLAAANKAQNVFLRGGNKVTIRAILPECYDWRNPGTQNVQILWSLDSTDGYLTKKSVLALQSELTSYYSIAGGEALSEEDFETVLESESENDTNDLNVYSQITNLRDAVDSHAIMDLNWFNTGDVSGKLRLVIVVDECYYFEWINDLESIIS